MNKNKLFNILLLILVVLIVVTIFYFFILKQQAGQCLQDPINYFFKESFDKDYMCSCNYNNQFYIFTSEVTQSIDMNSSTSDLEGL